MPGSKGEVDISTRVDFENHAHFVFKTYRYTREESGLEMDARDIG
jgi:hypothetical protein